MSSSAFGYCVQCKRQHVLKHGAALDLCIDLMESFKNFGRIDFETPATEAHPHLKTSYLDGDARGQMFGVLVCEDLEGRVHRLKGFSGQYNGIWKVPGWVPPLFELNQFDRLVTNTDPIIKLLGRKINQLKDGRSKQVLIKKRRWYSQELMHKIHQLYQVRNFKGQKKTLFDLFKKGIPAGAGDCCAPKLLNYAACHQLKPLALSEFYWGRDNRSNTRHNGCFYSACKEKCQPLLGFMLCGK